MTEALVHDISQSALQIFLLKPLYEQGLIILFFIVGLSILGWLILKFIRSLRKDSRLRVSKDGVEIDTGLDPNSLRKEDLTPMEHKFLAIIDENNRKKDKEIAELKAMIVILQTRVQELETDKIVKQKEEESKLKQLIPLSQHEVFTNLRAMMDPGISLEGVPISEEKKIIVKNFLEECKIPVFRNNLRSFVISMENASETDKLQLLYKLPELIYTWIDEYNHRARELKILLPNGACIYGIPEIFISRFDEWHSEHVNVTFEKIKGTIFSSFYKSWQMRMIIILDLFDTMFALTLQDAKKAIISLNGELEREIQAKFDACR